MLCCPQGLHAKQLTSGVSKGAVKPAARGGEGATTADGRATGNDDDGDAGGGNGRSTGDGRPNGEGQNDGRRQRAGDWRRVTDWRRQNDGRRQLAGRRKIRFIPGWDVELY